MKLLFLLVLLALLIILPLSLSGETPDTGDLPDSIYGFTVKTIDGEERSLADYKGKVLLIVNTASKCGYTKQYASLETLYEKYREAGLEILGFPANNFLRQEPGTDSEIKSFCSIKFGVTFDLFSKISVKGKDQAPLYRFLTTRPGVEGKIKWNFTKFLVDRKGNVVARFGSGTDPLEEKVVKEIDKLL